MERQTAEILRILDRAADAAIWDKRAGDRAERINRLLWDQQAGLYFDYEFVHHRLRNYPFATTFFPMWAGIASPEQAAAVVRNLTLFEKPGGLETSPNPSANQWDAPFAWAPLQMVAVEGLRRYGYNTEADRISREFLSMVVEQYQQRGIIVEKYDAVRRSMDVSRGIQFGYSSNEAGFGWTNGVFTALYDALPAQQKQELLGR
jgi:alpha,alpha-trehalase